MDTRSKTAAQKTKSRAPAIKTTVADVTSRVCIICQDSNGIVEPLGCACRGAMGIHRVCRTEHLASNYPSLGKHWFDSGPPLGTYANFPCPTCRTNMALRPIPEPLIFTYLRLAKSCALTALVTIDFAEILASGLVYWFVLWTTGQLEYGPTFTRLAGAVLVRYAAWIIVWKLLRFPPWNDLSTIGARLMAVVNFVVPVALIAYFAEAILFPYSATVTSRKWIGEILCLLFHSVMLLVLSAVMLLLICALNELNTWVKRKRAVTYWQPIDVAQ